MILIDNNTVSMEAQFDEPVVPAGSAALAYYFLEYSVAGQPVVLGPHIPASAGGSQHVTTTIVIPAPVGQITALTIDATVVDVNGQSAHSSSVSVNINRLAPIAPINFTIA